ncbi:response regulator [Candidatus Binatia bacterium]|nr:response regulator [Candidatus Binatia bacterium]
MSPKPKILIVDDEEGPRESLKIILKHEFEVVTLGRGSEAVEMLRDGGFDLILLDITMPEDLSGIDTLQAIRAAAIDVEAIVISGQGATDPIMACVNLGAHRYIKKPYRADEVLGAVRSAIAQRTARLRAQAMRERLLGSLSHELRTPLNAIVGYTEILHDEVRERLDDDHRHALARIQHSSERLLAYWESLFFLGELDSGSIIVKPGEVRMRSLLERLVSRVGHGSEDGPTIRVCCPDDLVAHTHPDSLARLLSVLLYECTDEDAGPIDITAARSPTGLSLTIEHDPTPFDDPTSSDLNEGAGVTELAREIIARASELLHATVSREASGDGRIVVRVSLPQRDPAPGPRPRFSSGFSSGALAASPR